MHAEHRRVVRFDGLPVAEIHMHATRQTRIEAAHSAHDVDAFEFVWPVLLEDRRVLHRVLIRSWRAIHVPRDWRSTASADMDDSWRFCPCG